MSDLHFKLMKMKYLTYIEVNEHEMSDLHERRFIEVNEHKPSDLD